MTATDAATSSGAVAEPEAAGLRRVITFWDASALVVGMIIGSGIFRAPASVAGHLPTAALIMMAWLIGGLLSLAGGLAAAELGARFPRSGGTYVFLREAFGPAVAFTFGWTTVLISKPSILAGIATVFAIYISDLAGLPPEARKALAMAAIALLTLVNCLGVKSGTRTQNLFTAAKTLGLALLGVGVFAAGHGDWSHFSSAPLKAPTATVGAADAADGTAGVAPGAADAAAGTGDAAAGPADAAAGTPDAAAGTGDAAAGTPDAAAGTAADAAGSATSAAGATSEVSTSGSAAVHSLVVALALGLVTILYTYDGWIDVTYTAGEVIRPERVLPRAILAGTLACTGLYLLANAAYVYVLSPSAMPGLENVASVALTRAFGSVGGRALALLVVISTLGVLNGSILTGVRVPYAMARDGILFGALGRVHSRTLSPVNALCAQGGFACLVVLFAKGFDEIASLFVSTTWFFYAVAFAGLLLIRWQDWRGGPRHERPSVSPGLDQGSSRGRSTPDTQGGHRVRMPFSVPAAILFIVVTLFIISSDLVFSGPRVLAGMAVVLAGVPVYKLWLSFRGRSQLNPAP